MEVFQRDATNYLWHSYSPIMTEIIPKYLIFYILNKNLNI